MLGGMKTEAVFLEILFQSADFQFGGRDEVEDPLDEALRMEAVGEVTGGGSGAGIANIDVEVTDLGRGLPVIRRVLQSLGVARSTVIRQHLPVERTHQVYE
jgi:hypothetical protein